MPPGRRREGARLRGLGGAALSSPPSASPGRQGGNPDLRLVGADGRDPAQDDLMYRSPCLRKDCSEPDTRTFAHAVSGGAHALLVTFLDAVDRLIAEYAAPERNTTLSLAEIREDPRFAFAEQVEAVELAKGLGKSMTLFRQEGVRYTDRSKSQASWIFVGTLSALVAVYGAPAPQCIRCLGPLRIANARPRTLPLRPPPQGLRSASSSARSLPTARRRGRSCCSSPKM